MSHGNEDGAPFGKDDLKQITAKLTRPVLKELVIDLYIMLQTHLGLLTDEQRQQAQAELEKIGIDDTTHRAWIEFYTIAKEVRGIR